jgi:hypothetical protein
MKKILLFALITRLSAAFFSPGYAFSDDHFETVEVAQRWQDDIPFVEKGEVYLFSLLYIGVHKLIFQGCEWLGIFNPEIKMLLIRLLHGIFSLVAVASAYRIARLLAPEATFRFFGRKFPVVDVVGFLMASFWLFPFMSVRSLREFVCIPFLLLGFEYLLRKSNYLPLLVSGFWFALAFDIRLQTVFFPLGAGLVLLFNKNTWRQAVIFGVAFVASVSLTQFLFDWLYWGNPLASVQAYTAYNATHAYDYLTGDWFMYLLTIGGLLLVPACFLFFAGFFADWRKHLLLFVPVMLFLAFHSYFPNKQERFILPAIPFLLLLGTAGFARIQAENQEKRLLTWTSNFLATWFLFFNTVGLAVMTFTFTKRSRVETISFLRQREDVSNVIFEGENEIPFPPLFYLGKRLVVPYKFYLGDRQPVYEILASQTADDLMKEINSGQRPAPNYIVFTGSHNLEARVERLQKSFPHLRRLVAVEPGFVDNVAFYLNPEHNVNETWYVFAIER